MRAIAEPLTNTLLSVIPDVVVKPGDFRDELGRLHCGKCSALKQTRIRLFPTDTEDRFLPVACLCEQRELAKAEVEKRLTERREANMRRLEGLCAIGASGMPRATFAANDMKDEKTTKILMRYIDHFDDAVSGNMGLMLYGDSGNGKTFFAECVATELMKRGYLVWMTSILSVVPVMNSDAANKLRIMSMIKSADLLILDDFGVERDTSYMTEQVYEIINERYKSGKPLMITTNLTSEYMRTQMDRSWKRISERILEMCTPVKVEGGTRRAALAKEKRDQLKQLLQLGGE